MILERVELGEVQIDDLLFFPTGGVFGLGRLLRRGRGRRREPPPWPGADFPAALPRVAVLAVLPAPPPAGGLLLRLGRAAPCAWASHPGPGPPCSWGGGHGGEAPAAPGASPTPARPPWPGPSAPARPDGRQVDHLVLRGRGTLHAGDHTLGPPAPGRAGPPTLRRGGSSVCPSGAGVVLISSAIRLTSLLFQIQTGAKTLFWPRLLLTFSSFPCHAKTPPFYSRAAFSVRLTVHFLLFIMFPFVKRCNYNNKIE